MDISVIRTYDVDLIKSFVEPLIDDIAEDGATGIDLNQYIDCLNDLWLCISLDDRPQGVIKFKAFSTSLIDFHPFIAKENRKNSLILVSTALKRLDNYAPVNYKGIISHAPECKIYATKFALKLGMIEVGRYKNAYFKDNKHHDMVLFQKSRG